MTDEPVQQEVETVADVEAWVARIAVAAEESDFEAAHWQEDELYRAVLRQVAAGSPLSRQLAAAALATDDLNFEHWWA